MTKMDEDTRVRVNDGEHDETKHCDNLYPTKSISRAWEAQDFNESRHASMTQAQRERHQERDGTVFAVAEDHERKGMDNNSMHNGGASHLERHLIARAKQPVVDSRRERGLVQTKNNRDQMIRSYMTTTEVSNDLEPSKMVGEGGGSQPEPASKAIVSFGADYNTTKRYDKAHIKGDTESRSVAARHTHYACTDNLATVHGAPKVNACNSHEKWTNAESPKRDVRILQVAKTTNRVQRKDPIDMGDLGLSPIKDVLRSKCRQDKDWIKTVPRRNDREWLRGALV